MKTKNAKSTKTVELPKSPDFERALELLDTLGTAHDELQNIEAITAEHIRSVLRDVKTKYAHHQERATLAEQFLEAICRKHPEWFSEKKTLKTIFGSLSLRLTPPKLSVGNPEAALVKLKLWAEREFSHTPEGDAARKEFLDRYIRTKEELNLDTLKGANKTLLGFIGAAIETEEAFSAKPTTLDLGKAIADDQKQAA